MPRKGLPAQGAEAILNAWDDANAAILTQKKKNKDTKESDNEAFRNYVNNGK